MVSFVAACCVWPMAHALLCIVSGDDSAVFFCPQWPWPLTFDPKFELGWDFCKMHLTAHIQSFGSYRADKQTNWQTNRRRWKHPPRFATVRRWVMRTIIVNHAYHSCYAGFYKSFFKKDFGDCCCIWILQRSNVLEAHPKMSEYWRQRAEGKGYRSTDFYG